jgi:hypothetical protein
MNTILNPDRPSSRSSENRSGSGDASRYRRHGTALPSWSDLEPKTNRRRQEPEDDGSFLENVSTVRFGLLLLVIAALFTLYVGHVHATQQLLMDVQEARQANHKLHLKHNRLKGEFDQATGPSVIYDRARELGLRESVPSGRTVVVPE